MAIGDIVTKVKANLGESFFESCTYGFVRQH